MLKEITLEKSTQLKKLLSHIIDKEEITTVFQPIVSLRDGSILGYEALSRGPEASPLQYPDALFCVAAENDRLWDLEQLCRTKALESAFRYNLDIQLFLNVNPSTIHDEKFKRGFTKEYLNRYGINPENINFEISEKSASSNLEGFKKTIEHYKKQNYKIAIDDAGAGYSGLNIITDIHPHYIKLDMNLIRNINSDSYRKALVKSLHEFCRIADISLIAEGIETLDELNTLIDIGVQYGQGFYIQRPDFKIKPIGAELLNTIKERNSKKNHVYHHYLSSIFIGNICRANAVVSPLSTAEEVYDLFLSDHDLLSVTVVDGNRTVGIITRTCIDHNMSGQFGYSLNAKRPVSAIMDNHPLLVDFKVPVDMVSKMAMSRPSETLYDFIVVTNNGEYCGVVTIKDLLEKTMEVEVSNARHQNPLSGLPGNLMIEHSLSKHTSSGEPFSVLYIDLDNFKAFNDVYGFESGDNVIRFVAGLLNDLIPKGNFIGHVGGDDFIVILSFYNIDALKAICSTITADFDSGIKGFYTSDDLEKGYIITRNRKGEQDRFPIMTISIAGVTNRKRSFENIYQLSEHASVIKKECKQIWKSCFYIE